MAGSAGSALVWLALACFAGAVALSFLGGRKPGLLRVSRWLMAGGSVSLFTVFGILLTLFLNKQYQFVYVHNHNQADYELQYKIAGLWAGQEGSILLWSCLTALFGLLTMNRFGQYQRWYVSAYSALLGIMAAISAYESPFKLILDPAGKPFLPPDGRGMAPPLLNYWMVIHPPTIFVGFALTAVAYSLAVSAMANRSLDDWIPLVRPWALACLGILGLGLCMGGFWAYETLGWGGFWVWDPVENTSFVPWCAMAAFVHGVFIQQARKKGHLANLLLAGAPFILFSYGTFLTRSGFLGDTSVHSFAKMDPQALGILIGLIGATSLGFISLFVPAAMWFKRSQPAPKEKDDKPFERTPLNLKTAYSAAIWLLLAFALVTAIGMSVPLIQSLASQQPKVVEESLYNQVLGWFFIPTMLGLSVAPYLSWRGLRGRDLIAAVVNPLAIAVMLTGFLLLWVKADWQGVAADPSQMTWLGSIVQVPRMYWVAFLAFLCFFAISANMWRMVEMIPRARRSVGGVLTHVGLAVALAGLIVSRGMEQERFVTVHPSRTPEAFGYQIGYVGPTKGFADRNNEIELQVVGDRDRFTAHPGLYFRPGPEGPQETIWPHIQRRPLYDLYFTIHPMTHGASETLGLNRGQQAKYEDMVVEYQGMRTTGVLGTDSARFFAKVKVTEIGEAVLATPSLKLSAGGETSLPSPVDNERSVTLLKADVEKSTIVLALSSRPDRPISLTQGATIETDGLRLTFNSFRTEQGETPEEARLVAQIEARPVSANKVVEPWMSLEENGPVKLNDTYELVLERIDAATKAAFLRFDYIQPAYPLEVYYKPLTWLVWLGVGIMTLGSLVAAAGRRTRSRREATKEPGVDSDFHPEPGKEEPKESEKPDAPVTVA